MCAYLSLRFSLLLLFFFSCCACIIFGFAVDLFDCVFFHFLCISYFARLFNNFPYLRFFKNRNYFSWNKSIVKTFKKSMRSQSLGKHSSVCIKLNNWVFWISCLQNRIFARSPKLPFSLYYNTLLLFKKKKLNKKLSCKLL